MKTIKTHLPAILYAIYLAVLLGITVVRPWNHAYRFLGGSVNPRVWVEYIPIYRTSLPLFLYLFVGNIVWFMPQGFYLAYFRRLPLLRVLGYGFLLSLFIEVMQFVLGTGVSEVDDLLLNAAGCALGALLAVVLRPRDA